MDEDDEEEDAGTVTEPKTYFPCTHDLVFENDLTFIRLWEKLVSDLTWPVQMKT